MRKNTFFENLKPEELVDSFVLPHGLNKLEKTKADASLKVVLNKKRALMAENQKHEIYPLKSF